MDDLTELFESVFKEARNTDELNNWWEGAFDTFKNYNVSAKVTFFSNSEDYDGLDGQFTTEIYNNPNSRKFEAWKDALVSLKKDIKLNLEDKINNYFEESSPTGTLESTGEGESKRFSIKYDNWMNKDFKFSGKDNSFSEFVIEINHERIQGGTPDKVKNTDTVEEKPSAFLKGTLLQTFKTSKLEYKDLSWQVGRYTDGKVTTYSGADNTLNKEDSPYLDDKNIDLAKPGLYTVTAKCVLIIKLFAE